MKQVRRKGVALPDILLNLTPFLLVAAIGITVMAGIIKGAVGFAMPLVMVSGLSSIMDPKLALAAIILPVVMSNGWQTFRQGVGAARGAIKDFRRYLIVVCLAIFLAAQTVSLIPDKVFYAVLGVPVVGLSVLQLLGLKFHIKPENRNRSEWGIGLISGILGGIAGTWGPTTVLYLMAINTPKAKQMVVQGVIYGLGSVTLFFAHIQSGILNRETAPLSALLLIPAAIGMVIGFRLQDRMDQALFRKVTLVILVVAGLNLIRKAFI